jgi:hypothetical protein
VHLKLHPYRQQIVFKVIHQKLTSRFYGPYKILEKINLVTYKLHLPTKSRVHHIFHVSLLKQYITNVENGVAHNTELLPFIDDGVVILTPQVILDHRWIK